MRFIVLAALFACAMAAVPAHRPRMGLPRLPLKLVLSGKMPLIDLDDRIVGGAEVVAHSLPFQLVLERKNALGNWGLSCGGSLIDETTVLNAAHCIAGSAASSIRFVAGEHNITSTDEITQIRYCSKITGHPQYNSRTFLNDIAIFKVSEAFDLSDPNVATIALPKSNITDGSSVTVSGWGTTKSGGSLSDVLKSVDVNVVSNTKCQDAYSNQETIADSMLCAGEEGKDSCQGDSGGPLFTGSGDTAIQHGVVSWGYGCADGTHPGVYTRVGYFLDWIADNRN